MSNFVNTSSTVLILVITLATVGVIVLGRKTEKALFPGILILVNLALLMYHSYVLNNLPQFMETQIAQVYLCLAMDFLWLLISFLGYLWIDDRVAIKFNKKSYDNSLSWFWDKL